MPVQEAALARRKAAHVVAEFGEDRLVTAAGDAGDGIEPLQRGAGRTLTYRKRQGGIKMNPNAQSGTTLHEIGDRIYRISSPVVVARGPSPSTNTSWSTMNGFSFPQGREGCTCGQCCRRFPSLRSHE